MWTQAYKGYYIHGYFDREECCYNSAEVGKMIRCKSLRAAKQAITRRINSK